LEDLFSSQKRPILMVSTNGERSLVGVEIPGLADFALDVVVAVLIPQTEVVVVQVARIALEDGGPLGLSFVDDRGREVQGVEASVVSLTERTGSGSIGRANPDVHVASIVIDPARVGRQRSVNVDLVVGSAVVEAIEQLGVSLDGAWNIRGERAELSLGEIFSVR